MVFTAPQTTAFFKNANQMGLSHRTRVHLQGEGIIHVRDLLDFADKDTWDQVVENCKRPPQVAGVGAQAGQLLNQAPFQLPAKSLLRLRVAAKIVEYYTRTARPLTAAGMQWVRLNNFKVEWETLVE